MKDALQPYETYCQRNLDEPHFPAGHEYCRCSPTVGEVTALASFALQKPIDGKCREHIFGLLGFGEIWEKMNGFITDWNQALANSSSGIAIMQRLYASYLSKALRSERIPQEEYERAYDVAVEELVGLAAVEA